MGWNGYVAGFGRRIVCIGRGCDENSGWEVVTCVAMLGIIGVNHSGEKT